MRIKYDELRPDFAGPSSLEQGNQSTQVFQVQGVGPSFFIIMAQHGAVEATGHGGRPGYEVTELMGLRDVALWAGLR